MHEIERAATVAAMRRYTSPALRRELAPPAEPTNSRDAERRAIAARELASRG